MRIRLGTLLLVATVGCGDPTVAPDNAQRPIAPKLATAASGWTVAVHVGGAGAGAALPARQYDVNVGTDEAGDVDVDLEGWIPQERESSSPRPTRATMRINGAVLLTMSDGSTSTTRLDRRTFRPLDELAAVSLPVGDPRAQRGGVFAAAAGRLATAEARRFPNAVITRSAADKQLAELRRTSHDERRLSTGRVEFWSTRGGTAVRTVFDETIGAVVEMAFDGADGPITVTRQYRAVTGGHQLAKRETVFLAGASSRRIVESFPVGDGLDR